MNDRVLYAYFEVDSNDLFVVTPEGNYFSFPCEKYSENSPSEQIIDPKSHKMYTVIFNE